MNRIYLGDNLPILRRLEDASVDLIYIDPPFNTGRRQARTRIRAVRSEDGDRTGFAGRRYRTVPLGSSAFPDRFDDYLAFLEPRLREARRLLISAKNTAIQLSWRKEITVEQKSYKASAPGTLMLLGEHAVLRGKRALCCAVDKRIHITLAAHPERTVIIHSVLGEYKSPLDQMPPSKQLSFIFSEKIFIPIILSLTSGN